MSEAETIKTARVLRARNWSWQGIAAHLGKSPTWLRARLIPGFAKKRRGAYRCIHEPRNGALRTIHANAMRLKAQIPADTRDLTARVMGDPLPGRSALDEKRRAA